MQMVMCTLVSGRMVKLMALGLTRFKVVVNMLVNGGRINAKAADSRRGSMDHGMKVTTKTG